MRFIHERESMVDRYNAIPPEAQEIVAEVAAAHNTFKPFLFADYPFPVSLMLARRDLFARLAAYTNERGFYAWPMDTMAGWFGISRNAFREAAAKSALFDGYRFKREDGKRVR